MLSALLNVPRNEPDWDRFFFDNKQQNDSIRAAIKAKSGNITRIATTSNGSGYTSAPTVTITDSRGNGVGATAIATYTVSGGFYNISIAVITQGAGYIAPIVSLIGGGGTGATALAGLRPITILTDYVLYPVNQQGFQDFLQANQQAHNDFNSFLGLQSSDIEELDPKNDNQLRAWIYLNYQELFSACSTLGI